MEKRERERGWADLADVNANPVDDEMGEEPNSTVEFAT